MCMEVLRTRLYFCNVFLYQRCLFLKLLKGRQGFGQLSKYLTMSFKNLYVQGEDEDGFQCNKGHQAVV